ncbi:MAG: AAA family ATPase [Phycisphaeraceae bacterium]|nr:AAA family ATPase [Phycisphaeraceae bacterium]
MSEPVLVSLSSVKSEPVRWLWPGRVPRGKVTMVCGDPGLGKSFVMMDMAARVSACLPWPDGPTPLRQAGSVLVLSAEDDPADTIRPRIEAAGGDPDRVLFLEGVRRQGAVAGLTLKLDAGAIEAALARMDRPRLIIVDPVSAYMGDTDSHNNAEVRAVLAELSRIAGRWGPSIVCVTHLNKSSGSRAVYRAMGSLAFTAAARMVWLVAKMPGDESRRAMVLVKSNLPASPSGLSFRIEPGGTGADGAGGRVRWEAGPVSISADFIEQSSTDDAAGPMDDAAEFLVEALTPGPRPAEDLFREAEQAGIAIKTLRRAKRVLNIRARREGGSGGHWVWSLPPGSGGAEGGAGGGAEGGGGGGGGEGGGGA